MSNNKIKLKDINNNTLYPQTKVSLLINDDETPAELQEKLVAGDGITIAPDGKTISSESKVDVDASLSTTSVNPVQNKIITNELNKKLNSNYLLTQGEKVEDGSVYSSMLLETTTVQGIPTGPALFHVAHLNTDSTILTYSLTIGNPASSVSFEGKTRPTCKIGTDQTLHQLAIKDDIKPTTDIGQTVGATPSPDLAVGGIFFDKIQTN